MESFGLSYSNDTLLFMQFSAISQLMLALVTFHTTKLAWDQSLESSTYLRLVKFTATFCKRVPGYFWYYGYHQLLFTLKILFGWPSHLHSIHLENG